MFGVISLERIESIPDQSLDPLVVPDERRTLLARSHLADYGKK